MKWLKVGSPEYEALMAKWRKDAYQEEMQTEYETYLEHEDAMGRLPNVK